MNRLLFCLISALLFTSCATMLNDQTHIVNIQSDLPDSKVKVNDSIYSLPTNIEVKRSNKDLNLTLLTDTKEIPFKAKRRLTWNFKYGNLYWIYFPYFPPFGYVTDLTNHKRFYYGKSLWLNSTAKDSAVTVLKEKDPRYKYVDSLSYYKHYIYKKGHFRINGSIPITNIYRLDLGNHEIKYDVNFGAFSFGADYFHMKDQFINATYSKILVDPFRETMGIFYMFPTGVYEEIDSDYFRLTNNHIVNRLSFGYGLSYGINHFSRTNIYDSSDSLNKKYNIFGLSFPVYYQAGRNLHIGLIYNPSYFRANQNNAWAYEHLISFDLAWKIRL